MRHRCLRIRLWPLSRADSSRVLVGAAGMWRFDWAQAGRRRSDWPERVQAFGVSARSDR